MTTIDLVKEHPELYKGKAEWREVIVPERTFLSVEGTGSPDGPAYADALQALYSTAYTLKFTRKKAGRDDFKVAPLEGLWWAENYAAFVQATQDKDSWKWRALIPVPEFVTTDEVAQAVAAARLKHPFGSEVSLWTYTEGRCLQYYWVGPYSDEQEVLLPLHSGGLEAMGLVESGLHHEIYLSDPRRTAPEKLKSVLRQPVKAR